MRLELIPVATNVTDLLDLYVDWGALAHGAAMASVGLALQPLLRTVYIAASYTYSTLFPWGTHPELDPLWSTEGISFIHHGCDATRLQKIRFISGFSVALRNLRVCTSLGAELNCGRCEKCLRTMIALHIAGKLSDCPMLPHAIDLDLVRKLRVRSSGQRIFLTELVQALENSPADALLRDTLQAALDVGELADPSRAADVAWMRNLHLATSDLERHFSPAARIILVDQDELRDLVRGSRHILPFLERDGGYFANPADDETAIQELQRMRAAGAEFLVFAWPAFWWFDCYPKFCQWVREQYECVLQNERLIAFDLRRPAGSVPSKD